jgi:long-subunit acyl-CoA synthetase (AMP-forming)/pyrroloquinoline quinone (PQQ) biosynthesis protein C
MSGAMHPFAVLIDAIAATGEDAPRVRWDGGAWSGAQLKARVDDIAEALVALGVRRIASRLDNGPQWLALDLAIRRLDRVHVPLPTFFTPAQIAHALSGSGADALVVADDQPSPEAPSATAGAAVSLDGGLRLQPLSPAAVALPAGTAVVTYTSGTTGAPKGVCLDAAALLTVADALADAAAPLAPRRHLCLMPLSTLLENVAGVYAALRSGAEIAVPSLAAIGYTGAAGLDVPTLLACLHRHRPESAIVLPQLLLALTMAGERGAPLPHSLTFLAVGGARVGAGLIARAQAQGLPVYEGYGLSECGSVVCLNRPGGERAGSVGRPLPHARVEVREGELYVEGVRCLGYLGEDGPPPGPIATGDLGHIDADGFVHVTGRRKHLFITSFGRNVSPEWVESELTQHPAFAQAVVFGEARPQNVAVVWPRMPDADDAALRAALAEVNRALPDYAQVRDLVRAEAPFSLADGLLTANGRPRRDAILARYGAAVEACHARHAATLAIDTIDTDALAIDSLPTEPTMPFHDRLLAETRRERETLIAVPIIQQALGGAIAREDYIAFLTQAFHHVRHTVPLLMACGARLPARLEWLRTAVGEYIEEEMGHHEWILDDLEACGAERAAVEHGQPSEATELMIAYAYDTIARGNPVGFFGMVLVLEGTSVALATRAAETIESSLGLPRNAFSYLRSHGDLDIEHTGFYETLMNRLDDEDDRRAVIHAAKRFYRLYGDIFRTLRADVARDDDRDLAVAA